MASAASPGGTLRSRRSTLVKAGRGARPGPQCTTPEDTFEIDTGVTAGALDSVDVQLNPPQHGPNRSPQRSYDGPVPTPDSQGSSSPAVNGVLPRLHMEQKAFLGRGSFGSVFKVFDRVLGRDVAVKEVWAGDDRMVTTLKKEYACLKTMNHPNVVRVYDLLTERNAAKIVMEWMPSGSVEAVIKANGPLPERVAMKYFRDAVEAIRHVHASGLLHRDLKPGNMLLDSNGIVKVSDFGTVRELSNSQSKTKHEVGTIPYMAPETVNGVVSRGGDIWSLGCSLLHMLAGRAPWAGSGMEPLQLLFRIGTAAPPQHHPPIPASLTLSPEVRAVLDQCFAHNHKDRPTAEELLASTTQFQPACEPDPCSPVTPPKGPKSRKYSMTAPLQEILAKYDVAEMAVPLEAAEVTTVGVLLALDENDLRAIDGLTVGGRKRLMQLIVAERKVGNDSAQFSPGTSSPHSPIVDEEGAAIVAPGSGSASTKAKRLPIHTAIKNNDLNAIKLQLAQGGKSVIRDVDPSTGYSPLMTAAESSTEHVIVFLATQPGCDARFQTETGVTPLHWVARRGLAGAAEALLQRGADPAAVSYCGRTPIRLAEEHQRRGVLDAFRRWDRLQQQ